MEDFHQQELSLFVSAPSDTSLQSREWIEYRPINQVTDTAALEFNIPAQSSAYIDLKRSVLRLKVKVVQRDDTPITEGEVVTLINLPLHTIFRQVEVNLQQTPLSHTGNNYPYKAYIDTLLKTNTAIQKAALRSQLFYKDTGDVGTNDAKTGSNLGLIARAS